MPYTLIMQTFAAAEQLQERQKTLNNLLNNLPRTVRELEEHCGLSLSADASIAISVVSQSASSESGVLFPSVIGGVLSLSMDTSASKYTPV